MPWKPPAEHTFPQLMIAGLSWSAWLLLTVSVGLGLFIVLLFYYSKNREAKD